MVDSQRKSTGRDYTATICLFALVFLFSPAVLIASRPPGYLPVSLAIACSAACAALGWISWTRSSQLFIPSIANQSTEPK